MKIAYQGVSSRHFSPARPAYFSVITFTTIGYGDYAPMGFWMRPFAGTEGLLGPMLMAVFTVSFARKLIR